MIFKRILSFFVTFGLIVPPTMADNLSQSDFNFAFDSQLIEVDYQAGDIVYMTEEQMLATEGEWVPVAVAGARVAYGGYKAYKVYKKAKKLKEHTKNQRPSNWNKHTKPRPGRDTEKKRQKPSWYKR